MNERSLSSTGDVADSTKRSTTGDSETTVDDEIAGLDAAAAESHDSGADSKSGSDSESGSVSESAESNGEEAELGWLTDPWYRTRAGVALLLVDVGLIVVLALATMTTVVSDFATVVAPQSTGHIPWFVYVFSALGGLGYVFTALLEDFQSETKSLLRYNLRVPAALPLGAGVWILSAVLVGADAAPELVLGLVFLSGLYVNLAYERLGAVARRLLPDSSSDESAEATEAEAEEGESSGDADAYLDEPRGADDTPSTPQTPSGAQTD